jgi:hypothetical protein
MLWPDVTSPVARRVLAQLFNLNDCKTDLREISDYGAELTPDDVKYAFWMRSRLRSSTLAQQLAAGPCAIPDVAVVASGWLAAFLRFFKPRTVEQYVNYVVVNLDWVLEPASPPDWRSQFNWGLLVGLATLMTFVSGKVFRMIHSSWLLLWIAFPFLIISIAISSSRAQRGSRLSVRRMIHATELYWYLRQAYSDIGFPDEQLPDPSAPHVS